MSVAGPSANCDYKLSNFYNSHHGDDSILALNLHQPSTSRDGATKRQWNHYVLASESSQSSDEGSETAYSIQGKETDLARDTSDLESNSSSDFVEYEIGTDEDSNPDVLQFIDSNESSSDDDLIQTTVIGAIIPEGDFLFADSEDSQTASSIDSELSPFDYWRCAQCQNTNNNPMFRYCEKCYKIRKDFFPPPPKHRKKRNRKRSKKQKSVQEKGSPIGITSNQHDQGIGIGLQSYKTSNNPPESIQSNVLHVDFLNAENCERGIKRKFENDSDDDEGSDAKRLCKSFLGDSIDLSSKPDIIPSHLFDLKDSVDSFSQPVFASFENIAVVQKSFSDPAVKFSKDDLDLDNEKLHSSDDGDLSMTKVDSFIGKADKSVGNDPIRDRSDMCITCLVEPKSGVFVHGRIAHICCCYKCSVKIWIKTKRCPICKCKVSNVLRAFVS